MRFYTKKKRAPSVIIVSLIDILAILLIFFIVTTTFKKDQPQMKINLPDAKTAEVAPAEKDNPIMLRVKSADEIMLDDQKVTTDTLGPVLQQLRAKEPKRPIAMQADRDAPFGVVVKVLDTLKAAGIKNIPTFTQPQDEK